MTLVSYHVEIVMSIGTDGRSVSTVCNQAFETFEAAAMSAEVMEHDKKLDFGQPVQYRVCRQTQETLDRKTGQPI